MTIKEIRQAADLTQKELADQYHIPLQTVKSWESDPKSKRYRKPPEYLPGMLERLIRIDFDMNAAEK